MSDREKEEDILFLASAEEARYNLDKPIAQQLVGMIMGNFKFGYGGYNGWFKNWSDLEKEIQEFINENKQGY